jgi:hypothetical protein
MYSTEKHVSNVHIILYGEMLPNQVRGRGPDDETKATRRRRDGGSSRAHAYRSVTEIAAPNVGESVWPATLMASLVSIPNRKICTRTELLATFSSSEND